MTATQRAYLRGEEPDISASTERTRRQTIRNRIRNAWNDTAIAFEYLSPDDAAQLVLQRQGSTKYLQDYRNDAETVPGPPELHWSYLQMELDDGPAAVGTGGLRQVFGLGFYSLYEGLVTKQGASTDFYESLVEALVSGALRDAAAKRGETVTVDVDIDFNASEQDELPSSPTSIEDVQQLFSRRAITADEYWGLLDREWNEEK